MLLCPKQKQQVEETEKPTILLRTVREVKSQGKLLMSKLERQVDIENHIISEHKLTSRTSVETNDGVGGCN